MANLKALGIKKDHSGAYDGAWRKTNGALLESTNPATGQVISSVRQATAADYDACVRAAQAAFERWRKVPAPVRGDYVRRIGNAFREHKDELGRLVTLETGKILQEGLGEIQEAIVSACNTAAGGSEKAEALSGLARAFFYAGARALLVSHWSVDSAATVTLVKQAVGATARDKTLGRAEALRRSMLAMIDSGEERNRHPALWAPFAVVGEGGASAGAPTTQVISPGTPTGTAPAPSKTGPSKKSGAPKGSDWKGTIWQGGG